jgi:hypothetical protein
VAEESNLAEFVNSIPGLCEYFDEVPWGGTSHGHQLADVQATARIARSVATSRSSTIVGPDQGSRLATMSQPSTRPL